MTENRLILNQGLEVIAVQEPQSIYEKIRGVKEYNDKDKKDFIDSLDSSLARNLRPVVLTLIGEPVSGKTHIGRDIVDFVFSDADGKKSKSVQIEKETGEKIPVFAIYWGDVIALAKYLGVIEKSNAAETTNPEQLGKITTLYKNILTEVISENQGKRCLILAESVGTTGAWLKKVEKDPNKPDVQNEFFGYDRGINALWDLVRKKKDFSQLNFDTFLLGISAAPWIRERGTNFKDKLKKVVGNSRDVARTFEESGEVFNPQNEEDMLHYAYESPSLDEVKVIERQTDELTLRLKEVEPMLFYNMDVDKYKHDSVYRSEIIGEMVIRYIFERNLRVKNKRHTFIAENFEEIEKVKFNNNNKIINYIWTKYPELKNL